MAHSALQNPVLWPVAHNKTLCCGPQRITKSCIVAHSASPNPALWLTAHHQILHCGSQRGNRHISFAVELHSVQWPIAKNQIRCNDPLAQKELKSQIFRRIQMFKLLLITIRGPIGCFWRNHFRQIISHFCRLQKILSLSLYRCKFVCFIMYSMYVHKLEFDRRYKLLSLYCPVKKYSPYATDIVLIQSVYCRILSRCNRVWNDDIY